MTSKLVVLIIRHAEKPEENWPGPGLTDAGSEDSKSLVIRGWQRAGAWAALFGAGLGGADYPAPDKIFAATPGNADRTDHGPSRRPSETVSALAARLNISVDTRFALGDEAHLVPTLLAESGVLLVCWEHHAIVDSILPAFSLPRGAAIAHWPGDRFDPVLRLDRAAGDTQFTFRQLTPRLLSHDPGSPMN